MYAHASSGRARTAETKLAWLAAGALCAGWLVSRLGTRPVALTAAISTFSLHSALTSTRQPGFETGFSVSRPQAPGKAAGRHRALPPAPLSQLGAALRPGRRRAAQHHKR